MSEMSETEISDELRAYFSKISRSRLQHQGKCVECGTVLENVTTQRAYCGWSCKSRAKRRREKARVQVLQQAAQVVAREQTPPYAQPCARCKVDTVSEELREHQGLCATCAMLAPHYHS